MRLLWAILCLLVALACSVPAPHARVDPSYIFLHHFEPRPLYLRVYIFIGPGDHIIMGPVDEWEGELTWMHELIMARPEGDRCKFHRSHLSEDRIKPAEMHYLGSIHEQHQHSLEAKIHEILSHPRYANVKGSPVFRHARCAAPFVRDFVHTVTTHGGKLGFQPPTPPKPTKEAAGHEHHEDTHGGQPIPGRHPSQDYTRSPYRKSPTPRPPWRGENGEWIPVRYKKDDRCGGTEMGGRPKRLFGDASFKTPDSI